jgi:cell division protein FtsW
VPNAHTDFIFAIIGEELGLIGTLLVLAAFGFFCYLGIRIAREAPDRFGFLVAGGITAWIGIQAVINIGAVTGMLPITGVPLPMISFGGTSLVLTMAAIGILLSIARRGRPPAKAPADVPGIAASGDAP